MARRYKRLKYEDRKELEEMFNSGSDPKTISEKLEVHIATIYRELERGMTEDHKYSADIAQRAI